MRESPERGLGNGDFGEDFSDYTWQVEVGDVPELPW